MAVYRIHVEKKKEYAVESRRLFLDIRDFLGIKSLLDLRILNRYDVEGIEESVFEQCRNTVFSESQLDHVYGENFGEAGGGIVFAVESLPGQYDQRSDSCAQCIQMAFRCERPLVRNARLYILYGKLSRGELEAVKKYVINPVECHEASMEKPETLILDYESAKSVAILNGFRFLSKGVIEQFCSGYGLAMDAEDLRFCRDYFASEGRDPSITELRVIDTYWSDHCRHTTFSTIIDTVEIDDPGIASSWERYLAIRRELGREDKPVTLMDLATIGARCMKAKGLLPFLDESEEINACSVKVNVNVNGSPEPWLLMFKNETHNHPTEIEPFGGAATCIGGAIRDPLSGRSYVYQAMRISGAANPLASPAETLPGKLPQHKIVTGAAAGFSSYGNQIGLATGFVREIYHPGYAAKRLELGAVLGAAPASQVIRKSPEAGDLIILLGGRTGRDGCGGATGSSKAHNFSSLESGGTEVQKGNAPEERKLQRLFRKEKVSRLIKRCNDFGAGGVSVAAGELARGLEIDLGKIPRKYEGLDGTELAISESQERMAAVVAPGDAETFLDYAAEENLEATVIAKVTAEERLRMNLDNRIIVDIAREFLDTNGAEKHACARIGKRAVNLPAESGIPAAGLHNKLSVKERFENLVKNLNVSSQRGLYERFDSTIGAGTVLMPGGGTYQASPIDAMVALFPVENGETDTVSLMSYGCDPYLTEQDPYCGAYSAVIESVARIVAAGGSRKECWLSFQEYFEKLKGPECWAKPLASLLGALDAQLELSVAAIGGKDSMSGSFENLHVPPTLVSFAVSVGNAENIISSEFQKAHSTVVLIKGEAGGFVKIFDYVESLIREKKALSARASGFGGTAEAIFKMCLGNRIGLRLDDSIDTGILFGKNYGSFVLELAGDGLEACSGNSNTMILLGRTIDQYRIITVNEEIDLLPLQKTWESVLEDVYPLGKEDAETVPVISYAEKAEARRSVFPVLGKPKAFIPVFPGTNCEYDTIHALERAGAEALPLIIRNLTKEDVSLSIEKAEQFIRESRMIVIPGGFSGADEPDGSGKFITAFFRNPRLKESIHELLEKRDGLMLGICNGFQALIKLGLVPFGRIAEGSAEPSAALQGSKASPQDNPTLTFNTIGRHQSMLVHTRISSVKSPWLSGCKTGDIHTIPVSHGEGRFVCSEAMMRSLIAEGQIAAQYADLEGRPSMDGRYNPNGSFYAVEAISSPDGRVLGKMAHSERWRKHCYKNVRGNHDQHLFESAVSFFS
ncbi:MAG: phosphoribosylformylglycinamidine synthase [Treponema sp.]|jgi:phosphoribosylformylglycinamidine synthase|nr:phosphoribosylformylglycinamidine synthase [Treponema sp.]